MGHRENLIPVNFDHICHFRWHVVYSHLDIQFYAICESIYFQISYAVSLGVIKNLLYWNLFQGLDRHGKFISSNEHNRYNSNLCKNKVYPLKFNRAKKGQSNTLYSITNLLQLVGNRLCVLTVMFAVFFPQLVAV